MNQNFNPTPNFHNYQPPKYDARYYLKCVLAFILIFTGLCTIFFSNLITSGLMQIVAAMLLFPPMIEAIEKASKTQLKRVVRYPAIALLVLISFVIAMESSETVSKQKTDTESNAIYQDYLNQQSEVIKNLSPTKQQNRNNALIELQNNPLYIKYSNEISAQYLPVLNALGEAIRGKDDSTYFLTEATENALNKEQMNVVRSEMKLLFAGGFTEDMLITFDKYKDKFGYYGLAGATGYNIDGKETDSITANYNLTPIFTVFDSNNKKLANSIYEVVAKGIVSWEDIKDRNFTYPYLYHKRDFNSYLKQVDPDSPYILNYDYELTAPELYSAYNANEVAADKKYKGKKVLITGIVESINKDVLGNSYVLLEANGLLTEVHCTIKDEDVAAKLQKDNQYTFLGTCDGMVLTSVVVDDCVKED